ncbi:MAG: hypothetical protein MZV64_35195 [Ignavibacteriales bacterium]|nr:hypothetical protein [Ignavibacteriales bacterium]
MVIKTTSLRLAVGEQEIIVEYGLGLEPQRFKGPDHLRLVCDHLRFKDAQSLFARQIDERLDHLHAEPAFAEVFCQEETHLGNVAMRTLAVMERGAAHRAVLDEREDGQDLAVIELFRPVADD